MPLDFPSNPVDGQVYDNFYYVASKGIWKSISSGASPNYLVGPTITNAVISATAPTSTAVPLTVSGAMSQSANLQEWKNNAGTTVLSVNYLGEISAPAINTAGLNVNRSDSSFEGGQITLRRSTDNAGYWNIDVYGNTATPSLRVFREVGGYTPAMVIDSSGRISKPNQPSFHAYHANASNFGLPVGSDFAFNSTRHNIGNCYNVSNGRFTAPISGQYFLSAHFFKYTQYDNNTNTYWGILINGSNVFISNHGAEGYDGGDTICGVVYMNAGDYATVRNLNGTLYTFAGEYNSFTGHLLG